MSRVAGWLAVLVLLGPLLVAVWVSFSPDSFLTLPTADWSTRWYRVLAENGRWRAALVRSAVVAALSALVAVIAGAPLAFAVARFRFRGRSVVSAGAILPAIVPPAVLGMGLLPVLYELGLWGSLVGLILTHGLLGLPVVFLIVRAHLDHFDPDVENVARGLGAGPWQVSYRITLPLLLPSLVVGGIAAFVISFNESMVTLFLATPNTETLPAVVWPQLRFAASPLVAVASCVSTTTAIVAVWVILRLRTPRVTS